MEVILSLFLFCIIIWVAYRYQDKQDRLARKIVHEKEKSERKRIADCHEIVRYFANNFGYIARSVISRGELEKLIESGADSDQICDEIFRRMKDILGIYLGYHAVANGKVPVILPNEIRDKHIYVIGKSGYGKTNFLRFLITQDMEFGNGLAALAPEHEMIVEEILPFIPEYRLKDVIYFNPADLEYPVVLNPLHIDSDDDIDLHVDEAFTILQRVVGEGGPRMDEILRHSLYALMERPGSTLLEIEKLLDRTNDTFRKEIIRNTTDEQLKSFFQNIYPKMPKDAHFPILNRIGRIIRSKYVRNCLCPPVHTTLNTQEIPRRLLNIRKAMDESKILLFNLSDGLLGEAASQLIGQFIVSKFQTATMSRADQAKAERKPYFLYLDEFQNFCGVASKSYERMLSRSRKYKLGLILAHQQTGQLPLELLKEIFGNVSTMISFQVSQSDAGKLSKEFINQQDFDVDNVPQDEFLRLNVGEAYCRINRNSFLMRVPLVNDQPDPSRAQAVIEQSRKDYGIPRLKFKKLPEPLSDSSDTNVLDDLDPDEVF